MSFDAFAAEFGKPRAGTSVGLSALHLEASKPLQDFVTAVEAASFPMA